MEKWEHNAIDHTAYLISAQGTSKDSIDEMLNSFGKDGWELVCIFEGIWFIFKRQLNSSMTRVKEGGEL